MSESSDFEKLLHDIKNPTQGMLEALKHLDQMYNDKEDLTTICRVLNNTTQQINEQWNKLNIFLTKKEMKK